MSIIIKKNVADYSLFSKKLKQCRGDFNHPPYEEITKKEKTKIEYRNLDIPWLKGIAKKM